jgi:hypothetical protein
MKTKTYFAFRVDIWDDIGNSIVEQTGRLTITEAARLRCGQQTKSRSGMARA